MPSTVVHAGLALVLMTGLLGRFYDRRALGVLLVILLIPEIDTLIGTLMAGAHRTLLHNLVLVACLGAWVFWDTHRESSWLRDHVGDAGVRIAWVGLFIHLFAHILLDWAHLEGINLLWPAHDQFFRLEGKAYLSTADGFVQTFVEFAEDPDTGSRVIDAGGGGTRRETHVANPVQPEPEPEPGPVDRRLPIAVQGWQLYLIVTGIFTAAARTIQSSRPDDRTRSSGES